MANKNDQLVNQVSSHSLGADFYALATYLFIIFFAPHERHEWLNYLRPAFSTAIITAILCLLRQLREKKQSSQKNPLQGLFLILLCSSMFFTNFMSPFSSNLLPPLLIDFIKLVILYFLIVNVIKTEYDLEVIVKIILTFGSFIVIYSLLAYKFNWGDIYFRMISPFGGMGSNSNGYAMFLLGLLSFFIMFFLKKASVPRKIFLGLLVLATLMCIIKTRSRMGFLGVIFQAGIVGWENKKNIVTVIVIGLMLSIASFLAHENFWERIYTIDEVNGQIDSSSPARQNKWRQAVVIINKHPFVGVGLSNFRTAVKRYGLGESEHIVHNAYLEIGAESGIISTALFLVCILYTIFMNRFAMKHYSIIRNEKMYLIAGALYISIASLGFCLIFLSEQYNSMLFVLLGLSGVLLKLTPRSKFAVR